MATWNVRTLTPGIDSSHLLPEIRKTAVVAAELLRLNIDIAALSETRLPEQGCIREKDYTFYWIGHPSDEKKEHGVGFAIRNSIIPYCVGIPVGISERLMKLSIKCFDSTCHIIAAYAPTLVSSAEAKDRFYDNLSATLSGIPASDSLFLLGDFNARVGNDFNSWQGILGPYGVGCMNENGQRLLELCSEFSLRISSSYFQGSMRSKVTWQHPRSKLWHQLDHVLTRSINHNFVHHVRSMHSADCNTDHALVRCKIVINLKKVHTARPKPKPRPNLAALKDNIALSSYQRALTEKIKDTMLPVDVDAAFEIVQRTITTTAKETLGVQYRRQPDWFLAYADIISPVLAEKRKLRNIYLANPTQANADCLKEAKSKAQRVSRQCIERYWQDLSSHIQHCADTGNLRGVYRGIKEAIGPKPRKMAPLLDLDGNTLTDPSQQMSRWVQHFRDLYSSKAPVNLDVINSLPRLSVLADLDIPPSVDEVTRAVKQMNCNKAAGDDGIPPELLKYGGEYLMKQIHSLILNCWASGTVPQKWKDSKIITLYKKRRSK